MGGFFFVWHAALRLSSSLVDPKMRLTCKYKEENSLIKVSKQTGF